MSVMIVDGSLATSMTWIAEYIDNINQDEKQSLSQLVAELVTPDEVSQEVYFSLAEASHSLLKAPDHEFEGVFNLLLYILSQSPDFSGCIPVVLASLNIETTETKQLLILAVLGNFFNVIDAKNKLRFDVLNKIIDFSTANGTLRQIAPQLHQLPEWLKLWDTDIDTVNDFYTRIVDLIEKHVGSQQAFSLLVDGVKFAESELLAKRLVKTALNNLFTYEFDEIAALPAVVALKDATFEAVVKGDIQAINASDEQALNKTRAIAFAKLAINKETIAYEDIFKATGLSDDLEVEALIIDTIKAGLIRGRMNQFDRVFAVERTSVTGEVTLDHWKIIDERLDVWRSQLQKHTDTLLSLQNPADRLAVPI